MAGGENATLPDRTPIVQCFKGLMYLCARANRKYLPRTRHLLRVMPRSRSLGKRLTTFEGSTSVLSGMRDHFAEFIRSSANVRDL